MREDDPRAGWAAALPINWCWAQFSDVAFDQTDSKRKLPTTRYQVSGDYPVIDQGDKFVSGFTDDADLVSKANLPCIVWGDHTRKTKFVEMPFVQGADGVKVLEPSGAVTPSFFAKQVAFAELPDKGYSRHFKFLRTKEFPLPPLPEQRRIVRKLDTLSARSATARTHLTAIEKLVERYRTGVLEAAFRAAWEAGCDTTIAGCLEHAETGLVRSKAEQTPDEGYPYIRMNHYDLAGRWNDRDLTYVAATPSEFDRYQLKANDLLFNTRNSAELVGKVAIWPAGKEGYLFNNNLLRMRFSPDVVPAFAFWQMSSPPFRRYIEGFISATTSVAAIYQRSLMAAPFWVPDTDEQREIVRLIETAFAKIDRLKAEAAKALKLLGHLDQRILAKAFAGDLVPQDPNDEPAATLLARIREERLGQPAARRRRRREA